MVRIKVERKTRIGKNVVFGVNKGAEVGVESALNILKTAVKSVAPVDKNRLRGSIQKERKGKTGKVYSDVEYAIYQEEGTSRMQAANSGKGYFKLGYDLVRDKMFRVFNAAIRRGLRGK